jgi:ABC-2 type transport system permease protein
VRNIGIVSRKEIKTYLASPMAYVVSAIFLGVSGTFFATYLASTNYSDTSMRGFLDASQFLILLLAALLTMRLVVEEKKQGTWELILTLPVRDAEVILGKFLGSLAVLSGMLVLTLYFPFLLLVFGDPDRGPIVTSYLGLFLLGCASLSIGIFASSMTTNQIVSAVMTGGILFGMWFFGLAGDYAPKGLGKILAYLSLSGYFTDFTRGIVDTRAVVYYLSITVLFLSMAIRSTEKDRWR